MLPKETLLKDLKIKLAINRILYPVFSALFVAIHRVFLPKKAKEMRTNKCLQVGTVLLN